MSQADPLRAEFAAEIEQQLFAALAAQAGLVVRTNDTAEYLRRAYAVRSKHHELSEVMLKRSPTEADRVWLVRKSKLQGDQADGPAHV